MPEELKKKLYIQAKKKGYSKDRADKYVYGTMNKLKVGRKKQSSPNNRKY